MLPNLKNPNRRLYILSRFAESGGVNGSDFPKTSFAETWLAGFNQSGSDRSRTKQTCTTVEKRWPGGSKFRKGKADETETSSSNPRFESAARADQSIPAEL
jgi:hypothetical protein